jgi:hypothetical protein
MVNVSFTDSPVAAPAVPVATASDLLKADDSHPVKINFLKFCGTNPPSIRQARKYFAANPRMKTLLSA